MVRMDKRNVKKFESALSPLELEALKILWEHKRMKVREIYEILKKNKKVALSSVAVIMDRLYEKGIVGREIETCKGGLRYIYFPLKDKKQLEKSIIENSVNGLIDKFGRAAVNYFNERFSR
jgi:predicted transcriptional regulator